MKRFKFVSDNSSSASQPVRSKSTKMNRKPRSEDHCIDDTQIARILSNKTTTVTGAFISVLEVKDTRYDIGVYGNFLAEIPRRLVTSAALDASVSAIAASYVSMYSGEKSVETLERYGKGLKALRVALNDPKEANSANTICAFYLMMICRVRKKFVTLMWGMIN